MKLLECSRAYKNFTNFLYNIIETSKEEKLAMYKNNLTLPIAKMMTREICTFFSLPLVSLAAVETRQKTYRGHYFHNEKKIVLYIQNGGLNYDTLLHELAHYYQREVLKDDGRKHHGPLFQASHFRVLAAADKLNLKS